MDFKNVLVLYKKSWKDKRLLFQMFFYDLITVLGIFGIVSLFSTLLIRKNASILGGRSVTAIQNLFLTGTDAEVSVLLSQIQGYLALLVFGSLITFILVLLFFGFTREKVWSRLTHKPFHKKKILSWTLHTLLLGFILFVLYIFVLLLRLIIFGQFINQEAVVLTIFKGLFTQFFWLVLFFFYFGAAFSFKKDYKAWHSIGESFALLKKSGKCLFKVLLLTLLTVALVTMLASFIFIKAFPGALLVSNLVQPLLVLFLFSWSRIYFYLAVRD